MYYHPNWQKKIISDLLFYLSKINEEHKKNIEGINILFVTHSPFILSDIPLANILFIEEHLIKGKPTSLPSSKVTNTFGANIHELLSDSFFMNNGLIGDFSKNHINDLFKYLNKNETINSWSEVAAEQTINLIGEPIVKSHLSQLFDNTFKANSELVLLEKESKRINDRIQKIKNNDKDSD